MNCDQVVADREAQQKAPTTYSCAACGAPVLMVGVSIRRDCEHVTSGVLASVRATAYGESALRK